MKRILIVEDDKALVIALTEALKGENFDVISADDGNRGYDLAKKEKIDLVLLDLILPGMNGLDVCRKLREEQVQTPILMLTSKKEEVDKVLGLELGADDYLTKPFGMRELIARVKALLRRQSTLAAKIEECAFGDALPLRAVCQENVETSCSVSIGGTVVSDPSVRRDNVGAERGRQWSS